MQSVIYNSLVVAILGQKAKNINLERNPVALWHVLGLTESNESLDGKD